MHRQRSVTAKRQLPHYSTLLSTASSMTCSANRAWVHSGERASLAQHQGGHSDCTETATVPVTKTLYKSCLTTVTAMHTASGRLGGSLAQGDRLAKLRGRLDKCTMAALMAAP